MFNKAKKVILVTLLFFGLSFIPPKQVSADGGLIADPSLFANLKEGQQVAVIKLGGDSSALVDLFVSVLDETGESHDLAYFVPLGFAPSGFQAFEEDSLTFANAQTMALDRIISEDSRGDWDYLRNLFAGALLTNGIWLIPFWLPMLLSGCGNPTVEPATSFATNSSTIKIVNIDATTDIQNLITATGLNESSVKGNLSRLQGQQIAIINIKTSPQVPSSTTSVANLSGSEPGLHLRWVTSLVSNNKEGAKYQYPLSTGASWASPIEMTRVYVVAPLDINFKVYYPKIGIDKSGFVQSGWKYEPRITRYANISAFAVDDGISQPFREIQMRVWRATFTQSNSAEDIHVVVSPKKGMPIGTTLRLKGAGMALLVGLIASILLWIIAWFLVMPKLLGKKVTIWRLLRIALTYIAWNMLLFLPAGFIMIFLTGDNRIIPLVLISIIFGSASVLIFTSGRMAKLAEVPGKSFKIFATVTGGSGFAYLIFAFCYARLVGAL